MRSTFNCLLLSLLPLIFAYSENAGAATATNPSSASDQVIQKVDPKDLSFSWVTEKGVFAFPWPFSAKWMWADPNRAMPFEHPRLEVEITIPDSAISVTFTNDDGIFTAAQGQKLKIGVHQRKVQWDVQVKTAKGISRVASRIEIKTKHTQLMIHPICSGHGIRIQTPFGTKRPLFLGLSCEQPTAETLHVFVSKPSDQKFKEVTSAIGEVTEETPDYFLWNIPVREIYKKKLGTIGLLETGEEYPVVFELTYGQPRFRDRPLPWTLSGMLGTEMLEFQDSSQSSSWASLASRFAWTYQTGDRSMIRAAVDGQLIGLGFGGLKLPARTWRFATGMTWLIGSQAQNYNVRMGIGLAGTGMVVPLQNDIRPFGFNRRLGPELTVSGNWIRSSAPPIEWRLEFATYPIDVVGFSLLNRDIRLAFQIPFSWKEFAGRFVPWSWVFQIHSLNLVESQLNPLRVISATSLTLGIQIDY